MNHTVVYTSGPHASVVTETEEEIIKLVNDNQGQYFKLTELDGAKITIFSNHVAYLRTVKQ